MNLLQTIISYYQGEARHGFWATVIGGLLLIGSIMIWKWASPLSLLKGFTVPMFLFGLLMGLGGGVNNIYTNKAAPGKIALYQKDSTAFLKQEKVKTEKTHRGWQGIRIFWGILGLSGMALSLLIRKPFWIGAGLGTIALAIFLSIFEYYSMRFNERYYQAIQSATAQKTNTNLQKPHIKAQQIIKQKGIKPQFIEQTHPKPVTDTLPSHTLHADSLNTLSAPGITAVIVKDSLNFNTPYEFQLPALINDVARIYPKDKKRKLLDYYNSDLIQANSVNANYCWFSKKYIKK